ncbi:hypothetical protein BDQ17DRAFT_1335218 [Cyathus striatus]|nr:hypothetical protein BDQ17DRAFT_1335218 [Cyathus striatus]
MPKLKLFNQECEYNNHTQVHGNTYHAHAQITISIYQFLSGTVSYINNILIHLIIPKNIRDSVHCHYPVVEVMLIMQLYTSWDEGKVIKYMVVTVTALASLLSMAFLVTFVHEAQDCLGIWCMFILQWLVIDTHWVAWSHFYQIY